MSTHEWLPILALPEFVELRRRRRKVTTTLGSIAIGLFAGFLVGFAYFPALLGENNLFGIPLSLWVVFSQFAGTWALVYSHFRLSRKYIEPAAAAAVAAIEAHVKANVS